MGYCWTGYEKKHLSLLERYKAIANVYYKKALGAVIVYDITKKESFLNVHQWYKELQERGEEGVQCVLVGNKLDLIHLRQVDEREGKSFASKHGIQFFETSAKDFTNVDEVFRAIVECVYSKGHPMTFEDIVNVVRDGAKLPSELDPNNGGKCC